MALYKPGDVVVVREDLNTRDIYGMNPRVGRGIAVVSRMLSLRGAPVTILRFSDEQWTIEEAGGAYVISEMSGVVWTDEMFSGFAYQNEEIDISEDDILRVLL